MSSIVGVTEKQLLKNPNVRHVAFDGEWYFSIYDLNLQYIGAFKNVGGLSLPLKDSTGLRTPIACIAYSQISKVAEALKDRPEFNQAIDVLFGFNPKKK